MGHKTKKRQQEKRINASRDKLLDLGWTKEDRAFHNRSQGIRRHRIGRVRNDCPKEFLKTVKRSGLPRALSSISFQQRTPQQTPSFRQLVASRNTRYEAQRDFTKKEFLAYLKDWLQVDEPRWNGIDTRKRSYPSGGGIYESTVFLLLQRIEGIVSGIYHADIEAGKIDLLVPIEELPTQLLTFPYIATGHRLKLPPPQAQVLIAADIKRLSWAYTSIPYRVALTNAAVVMTYGLLWAEAHRLAAFPMGLYPSNVLSQVLGVSEDEYPLMAQFCLIGSLETNRSAGKSRKRMGRGR